MNKYQDALNSLNPNYIGKQEYSWRKATELLQELVDKETPMKVTEELGAPVSYEQYRKCPKCKDVVARMHSYCPFCGQKLDWSECENE